MNLNRLIVFRLFFVISVILLFSIPLYDSLPLQGDTSLQSEPLGTPPWKVIGKYTHPPIKESSGVVASRRFPGVYWTLNDSGNPAVLYATTIEGKLIREFPVQGTINLDWEDLAIDDKGQLWIGDIGNNFHLRNNLTIYVVPEPNPTKDTEAKALAKYTYRYPDNNVDAEGMFIYNGLPYIVSKEYNRAILYRFTDLKTGEINVLEKVGQLKGASFVTGADMSPDSKRLAVCSYQAVWIYHAPNPAESNKLGQSDQIIHLISSQPWILANDFDAEAIGFDHYDLVLTSENRNIYRLPKWWYEQELPLPPGNTLSASSLLATTKTNGTKFYVERYQQLGLEIGGGHLVLAADHSGATISQFIQIPREDRYEISLVLSRGPEYARMALLIDGKQLGQIYDCYAASPIIGSLIAFGSTYLTEGQHEFSLQVVGKSSDFLSYKAGIDSYLIRPNSSFAPQYLVLGPFPKANPDNIEASLPPEELASAPETLLKATFQDVFGHSIRWKEVKSDSNGKLDLLKSLGEEGLKTAVAYALTYVYSQEAREATLLVGSDDQVAIWVNGKEAHRHNIARGAAPDQDVVTCHLKAGWNAVLCKIGQDVGGWALYLRANDPDGSLKYSIKP